jgi:NTE family protein
MSEVMKYMVRGGCRLLATLLAIFIVCEAMAGRPKIGIVFGGGGAKGAAEVGVLKVLEETGIQVDYIAGTSIGSIVGGLYAAGYKANELETMFQTQEWLSLLTDRKASLINEPYQTINGVTYIFGFPVMDRNSSIFGIMKGETVENMLDSMLSVKGCKTFESLPVPFCCVTADIRTAREVVISKGSISKAMRASMSIPGIFKPVKLDDRLLVDGGMLNNLPVDVCRKMGADIVIAIDLQQEEQKPRKQTDLSMLSSLADLIGFGGILEWITNRPDIEKYLENRKKADIYIHPNLPDADASSFGNKNAARMIQAGITAAKQIVPELQRAINGSQGH